MNWISSAIREELYFYGIPLVEETFLRFGKEGEIFKHLNLVSLCQYVGKRRVKALGISVL